MKLFFCLIVSILWSSETQLEKKVNWNQLHQFNFTPEMMLCGAFQMSRGVQFQEICAFPHTFWEVDRAKEEKHCFTGGSLRGYRYILLTVGKHLKRELALKNKYILTAIELLFGQPPRGNIYLRVNELFLAHYCLFAVAKHKVLSKFQLVQLAAIAGEQNTPGALQDLPLYRGT